MKLFDYETYEDYGKERFFQVFTSRKFALLDLSVQWDDYDDDKIFPRISLSVGPTHLCDFSFGWKRIRFDFSIIDFAPRDLSYYRQK